MIRKFLRSLKGLRPIVIGREKINDKALVQRYCRGNVRLQMGHMTFAEEFKKLSDRVCSYEF